KAEVNEFDVLIFNCLEYLFWGHSFFLETGIVFMESVTAKNGQHSAIKRKSPRLQKIGIEDFVVSSLTRLCVYFVFYNLNIFTLSMGKFRDGEEKTRVREKGVKEGVRPFSRNATYCIHYDSRFAGRSLTPFLTPFFPDLFIGL